jgi:putative colanic acid biosynthesis acetyltransferase WcaF
MDLSRYSVADFDRGASRFKEMLWQFCRCTFFAPPWPLPSAFRVALLRMFGATIGSGVVVRSEVNITFPWRLVIGDHVWLGEGVTILSLAPVTIESNVCISQKAFLCTGSHRWRSELFELKTAPIVVRSGTWIAACAFIGPGVEIGAGSVISAGAVVFDHVPPGSLARGNPAQVAPKTH